MGRATLARRNAADHLRAIGQRLFGVEGAGGAGHTLRDDLGVLVHQNGHVSPFAFCGRGTSDEGSMSQAAHSPGTHWCSSWLRRARDRSPCRLPAVP